MFSGFKAVMNDIEVTMRKDPAARTAIEVYFLYPHIKALKTYRKAHKLYQKGHFFAARWLSQRARKKTGIEIHPGAQIGKNLFIDHGMGVVIGETTIIGDNVTLYQGVTLGGTGKDKGKRHPTLGNCVVVGSGAKILGNIYIAAGTKVGANAVVLKDTTSESTAVGIPARLIQKDVWYFNL
nr:serine O-acetyltransferase EpsC [uncultured Acetobacterium sp.]